MEWLGGVLLVVGILALLALRWKLAGRRRRHSELYRAHLASAEWRATCRRIHARAGYRCERRVWWLWRCSRRSVQVHHLTYRRLGKERDTDLQAVCLACHPRADRERRAHVWRS